MIMKQLYTSYNETHNIELFYNWKTDGFKKK